MKAVRSLIALALAALLQPLPGAAAPITLSFDDVNTSVPPFLQPDYGGLQWSLNWLYGTYMAASPPYAAYVFSAGTIDFGEDVNFIGSYLYTSEGALGNRVWWEGWNDGVKIYESAHLEGPYAGTFELNWQGVDRLRLRTDGGTYAHIDDFVYERIAVVPEPSSAALAVGGLLLLALRRQRQGRWCSTSGSTAVAPASRSSAAATVADQPLR